MKCLPKALVSALVLSLIGCKSGYNIPPVVTPPTGASIPCDPDAANSDTSAEALALLELVATFSCEKDSTNKRVFSGQVLGTAENAQNYDRYNQLFSVFKDNSGNNNTPAVLNLDYSLTGSWNIVQLTNANTVLEGHWDYGGINIVSWTPSNPWQDNFNTGYTSNVDLNSLREGSLSTAETRWADDIKRLTTALLDLQRRRVAVIFRPLPLMNSDRYWWGINATGDNKESDFEALWSDLYKRLNNAGVNNILWAYSPLDTAENNTKAFDWGFNKTYIDIVTPVVRNNSLEIRDYDAYKTLGKPLGLAEFSPATSDGNFDTVKYESQLITNYPAMAFWLSGVNDGDIKRTLADNKNSFTLLTKTTVITVEKMETQGLLSY